MKIIAISKRTLASLLELGRNSFKDPVTRRVPVEFLALISAKKGVIQGDLYLLPGTIGGSETASFPLDMIPLNLGHVGSAHSHPNGVIRPSDADILFFSRTGPCHIIVGYPYEEGCWGCFNADGTRREIEVINDE